MTFMKLYNTLTYLPRLFICIRKRFIVVVIRQTGNYGTLDFGTVN